MTADLLAWFKKVPNNSTLNFKRAGCYRIDGELVVSKRIGLTFNGNGATFDGKRNSNGKARHWSVQNSSNITLKNMTVRGANPRAGARKDGYRRGYEWQHAYGVYGSNHVVLDSVQAYDLYGDFVEIMPMWVGRNPVTARNITVQNSHFERSGRQGVAIVGGEDILIRDNYIGGVPLDILDIEPAFPTLPVKNVRFVHNTTGPVWLVWFANHGRCNAGVSNITVSDNVMEARASNDYPAIWVKPPADCARRGPFTVERNTFLVRQPPAGLMLDRTHDVLLRGNKVRFEFAGPGDRTRVLVELVKSTRVSVLSNSVRVDPRDKVVFITHDGESDYVSSGNKRI
ncbi:MAG: right-handed parallel beta-helix repeat-containing protein [Actinomycetota bacterium]